MLFKEITQCGKYILKWKFGDYLKQGPSIVEWQDAEIEVISVGPTNFRVQYKKRGGQKGVEDFSKTHDSWELVPFDWDI